MDIERKDITCHVKQQPPGYSFTTRAYDQHQLIWVTHGLLHLRADRDIDGSVRLRPGMFVLLPPDAGFGLWCESEGYQGIGVSSREIRDQLPADTHPIHGTGDSSLHLLIQLISRHMHAPLPESRQILIGLSQALLGEVCALLRERRALTHRDWASAAATAITLNLGTGRSVRDVVATLPLSYRQVSRCFQSRYGTSMKRYQALLRVDEARRLLAGTALDMTAIAMELGYASSQHFATQFRQLTGCTPTAYRETQV